MKIYANNIKNKVIHEFDRLPSKDDLEYVKKLFPQTVVYRKSNNHCCLFSEIKHKNINWYK